MRLRLLPLVVLCVMAVAGCSGSPPTTEPGPATASVATDATATMDPALAVPCGEARNLIISATGTFTTQLADAVSAGERGDAARQNTALNLIRGTFARWAANLREQAGRAADPRLKTVLLEYAGAVETTIAKVKTPADLDKLYTFTEQELDLTADRFAQVCPA